ncbi:hypothetical protein KQX54_011362 [Cotesia glomerata]|uniref:Uncharacterized protein n=1 Tax=Cotesia glomerata TaxID=32391 RepID=A0AAV7IN50_COTGL|nr:hypothetical protein KQX54_011362 [Cotesia glomerata]
MESRTTINTLQSILCSLAKAPVSYPRGERSQIRGRGFEPRKFLATTTGFRRKGHEKRETRHNHRVETNIHNSMVAPLSEHCAAVTSVSGMGVVKARGRGLYKGDSFYLGKYQYLYPEYSALCLCICKPNTREFYAVMHNIIIIVVFLLVGLFLTLNLQ